MIDFLWPWYEFSSWGSRCVLTLRFARPSKSSRIRNGNCFRNLTWEIFSTVVVDKLKGKWTTKWFSFHAFLFHFFTPSIRNKNRFLCFFYVIVVVNFWFLPWMFVCNGTKKELKRRSHRRKMIVVLWALENQQKAWNYDMRKYVKRISIAMSFSRLHSRLCCLRWNDVPLSVTSVCFYLK